VARHWRCTLPRTLCADVWCLPLHLRLLVLPEVLTDELVLLAFLVLAFLAVDSCLPSSPLTSRRWAWCASASPRSRPRTASGARCARAWSDRQYCPVTVRGTLDGVAYAYVLRSIGSWCSQQQGKQRHSQPGCSDGGNC
jgi:hypothetical protein